MKSPFLRAQNKADIAFSKLVRAEVPYCEFHTWFEYAGNPAPCKCIGPLQCCHKIRREKKSVRYDRQNVFSGCSGSNCWSKFHQAEWDELWRKMWPRDVEHLELVSRTTVKRSTEDLLQMAAYFDRERERL